MASDKKASSRTAGTKPARKNQKGDSPKRENATRESILEAAAWLIVDEGYGACTMRSISQKVNIKAGSLYYHFASKEEIVIEIMNKGVAMLLEEVRRADEALPADSPFFDRLRTAVWVHLSCLLDRNIPFMRVYDHLTVAIRMRGRAMRRKYSEFWKDLIEDGKRAGEVREDLNTALFVSYILSGMNRVPDWFNRDRSKVEEIADLVVGVSAIGIVTPSAAGKAAGASKLSLAAT